MSTAIQSPPRGPAPPPPLPPGQKTLTPLPDIILRLIASGLIVGAYMFLREVVLDQLQDVLDRIPDSSWKPGPATPAALAITVVFAALVAVWWRFIQRDQRFYAPLLITYILAVGDATFGILLNQHSEFLARWTNDRITSYSPTFLAILAAIALEIVLAKFTTGKWPHLASSYISGISAGILVKSPELWPFVLTAWISIASKYVLRVRGRHLWNPTNFGVSVMLWLAANHMHALSVEAGNAIWPVVVIWLLGSLILYRFKLLHIPLVFVATFIPLAFLRAGLLPTTDRFLNSLANELAPMTAPMFQLFIFFMITDPKTITKPRWSQCLVVVLVGVADMVLRLFEDKYSLFHALFIVGPISNLIEIWWTAGQPKVVKPVPVPAGAG